MPTSIRRALDALRAVPAASGAVVMGTGIVSIALSLEHHDVLSFAVFAVAAVIWLALGLLLVRRVVRDRRRVRREAASPAALTGVAATAVLGTRIVGLGWHPVGAALLAVAVCLWLLLIGPVLRAWVAAAGGVAFMAVVSTESLAVLAAGLAEADRSSWLLYAGGAAFVAGLALYPFVLWSFDFGQLLRGAGDHWITGGALAISTLAGSRIAAGTHGLDVLAGVTPALRTLSLVLWALTLAWLPVLLGVEVLSPRPRYDVRRWATVFPVGMYAACSFDIGSLTGIGGISEFARIWTWVAFALWLAVALAALRHVTGRGAAEHAPGGPHEVPASRR